MTEHDLEALVTPEAVQRMVAAAAYPEHDDGHVHCYYEGLLRAALGIAPSLPSPEDVYGILRGYEVPE